MKTKFLLLMTLVMVAFQGWTAPVDLKKAQMVAQNFTINSGNLYASTVGGGISLAYTQQSERVKDEPVFYVFNTGNGFIIVSGDDRADDILAYGEGKFDINDIPDGMKFMLGMYKEQIDYLFSHPNLNVEKVSLASQSLNATSVAKLLNTTWDQTIPYCKQCPVIGSYYCPTGCAATALAQIMYYWRYPTNAPSLSAYTTRSRGIKVGALSSRTISWGNMLSKYNYDPTGKTTNYNETQANAIAWLMRYVGQAEQMDYNTIDQGGSGASDYDVLAAAKKFGYNSNAQVVNKTSAYTDAKWASMIQTELLAKRPVYYGGSHKKSDGTYAGHAFVLDGYNASTNKYHINWGANGYCDGYFSLNAFKDGNNYTYNYYQAMITDLRPMTILSINPNPVAFNSKTVGKTYTASISIKGYHLTGNLSLKLSGSSMFSINKTTISKSAATGSTTVTVTYKPTSAGTHNATITISGGGLTTNKTISLKGTAVKRVITVTPEIVSFFKVPKGTTVKKTFKVTATNLTGPLSVSLTDATGMFSINKSSITATQAANGYTVSVYFTATKLGIHTAYITINGGDALESKKITLKGSCVKNLGPTNEVMGRFDNGLVTNSINSFVVTGGNDNGNGNGTSVMAPNSSLTDDELAFDGSINVEGQNTTESPMVQNIATGLSELARDVKIYAVGRDIVIETPVEQSSIVSDIAGHARRVNLQAGRNVIPAGGNGVHIVRVGEKSAKLMLR